MQRSTLVASLFALILLTPALAVAAEQQQEAVVTFGDLDTATDRGAARALGRIRNAAQDVCDAAPGLRLFEDRVAARACIQDAMSRAVDDLGDPMVAAKFNGIRLYARTGERS